MAGQLADSCAVPRVMVYDGLSGTGASSSSGTSGFV
jgi:hypothetical protein